MRGNLSLMTAAVLLVVGWLIVFVEQTVSLR
jgi:hypothetical protein